VIGYVLARRYAKAIIDLAGEAKLLKEVGEDLRAIAETFDQSPELVHVFSDPTVSPEEKEKVLAEVLKSAKLQDLSLKFVHVLLEKHRILGIGEVADAYQTLYDDLENRVRAKVVSAAKLAKKEEDRIQAALSKISGKEVILQVEVDKSLLGGVVTYMGSQVYDGSLKNQLQQIKDSLSKGR
jgi:F-type H+-transporting ATPase subunit delta